MKKAPTTRGQCLAGPRPCPWSRCRYHLGGDLVASGQTTEGPRYRERPCGDGLDSCALDVADRRGDLTLAEVGAQMGVTGERIRRIEAVALAKLKEDLGGAFDVWAQARRAAQGDDVAPDCPVEDFDLRLELAEWRWPGVTAPPMRDLRKQGSRKTRGAA